MKQWEWTNPNMLLCTILPILNPGQNKPLADNTHFNPYGAYQIAKCVIEGMKKAELPFVRFLRTDYEGYNPAQPDARESFKWNDCPFTEIEKPDGN